METSVFLAKVFSLYFLLIGLAIILRRSWYQEVFVGFFDCKHCLFLATFLTVIIGILLVVVHPAFTNDWRSVITVLAWLTLLKGMVYLFLPKQLTKYKRHLLTYPPVYYISGIITIGLGLYLGCKGFFA